MTVNVRRPRLSMAQPCHTRGASVTPEEHHDAHLTSHAWQTRHSSLVNDSHALDITHHRRRLLLFTLPPSLALDPFIALPFAAMLASLTRLSIMLPLTAAFVVGSSSTPLLASESIRHSSLTPTRRAGSMLYCRL